MLIQPLDPRPHWLLLRTKPRQEHKALLTLASRGIAAYCPQMLEPYRRPWEPRGPMPLFPGYLFAWLVVQDRLAAVRYCPGVVGPVRMALCFAVLEDELVTALREREGGRGYIVVERPRKELRPGSRVRVAKGALSGIEGIVSRYIPARKRVQLLLGLACAVRAAEVPANDVRCV